MTTASLSAADGVVRVVLPLIAVTASDGRSTVIVATVAAVGASAWLFASIPAGVLLDRCDIRKVLLTANVVRAVTFLAASLVPHGLSVSALLLVAFSVGVCEVIVDSGCSACLPRIVLSPDLPRANATLFSIQTLLNDFMGPLLAAGVYALGSTASLLTASALYAMSACACLALPALSDASRGAGRTGNVAHDARAGLLYVHQSPFLRRLCVVSALYGLSWSAAFSILVVVSHEVYGVGATGYSGLLLSGAAGSLIGARVAAPLVERYGSTRILQSSLVGAGITTSGLGMAHVLVVGVVMSFLGGVAGILWNITAVAIRQQSVPSDYIGRVTAVFRLCTWGSIPMGALVGGLVASRTSASAVFIISGLAMGALGSIVLKGLRAPGPASAAAR